MIRLDTKFESKIPIEADVCIEINWKRIYDFLKEHPDASLDEFTNNMVLIWETEEDFILVRQG